MYTPVHQCAVFITPGTVNGPDLSPEVRVFLFFRIYMTLVYIFYYLNFFFAL